MFTIRMAEISKHAGNAGDGIVRGYIFDDTPSVSVCSSIEGPEIIGAFNLDLAGGNVDFTDYHTQAISGHANTFFPWGTDATFSAGDCLYVSSPEPFTQMRITINTGAVWNSTFSDPLDQVLICDSVGGYRLDRVLTVVADTTNGLRNTGTHVIEWTAPPTPTAVWTPVPGLIAPAQWICISPKGYVPLSAPPQVAPKASMTYLLGSGNDHTDLTLVYNDVMSSATFPTFPDVVYFPGADTIFSFTAPAPGMDIEVHQKSANYYDHVLEYYSVGGVWTPFDPSYIDDPSNGMKNGPATLGVDPPELFHVRWKLPSDWDVTTLNITGIGDVIGAHMRMRVTNVLNVGPTQPPLARARGRTLDNAGGIIHLAQATYTALTYDASIPPSGNTELQLLNMNSHASAIATFPAHVRSSCNILPLQRLVLQPTPLTVNPGESLLLTWQSGDVLQDVEIVLE